ncbi:reticulocalbin-2 [Gadus morhua]|uniref:Reticulocalbin-3 n=1 Tax=Gadus morhua TaxID=8049 RepID=A0A8C4Z4M2_GADMO|nr:reticulocalbin-2 [Gadus morhua]XP_030222689.1 reticulocalbin-2 [Gadus morhua]
MTLSALIALLAINFAFGAGLEDNHYIDQQHNPGHDVNVLIGNQNTKETGQMDPSQQREKIIEIVKKIDINSDKMLSTEELALWIQQVYRKYALEDVEERFPKFDPNADGVVSWEEYNTQQGLITLDDAAVLNDPEQESIRYLSLKEKRRFDFADVDDTAGLNLPEFLAFTHPSEVDHMADFTIEDVLSEYDRDGDGFISLTEFIGDVRGNGDSTPSQWEVEETVRFKELYDQDKDGKLNPQEQLRWVAPNSYGSAREEALHLVKEMDHDGDGKISEAEVLKNQESFMNSEVTDYGRQLITSHDEL